MPLPMPTDEKHRKRRSSKRSAEHSSRSHAEPKKHDPPVLPDPEPSERPATLDDLRKARLSHLEPSDEQKQQKMKYEYVRTVPVKAKASDDAKTTTRGSSISESKSTAKPAGRSASSKRHRSTKKDDAEEPDQYVYRTNPETTQSSRATGAQGVNAGHDHRPTMYRSTSVRTERRRTERRHTEPVPRRRSIVSSAIAPPSARPSLRKSTTTASSSSKPAAEKSSSLTKAETKVSATTAPTAAGKKSSGVLSGLFGSKPAVPERKASCLTCGDDVGISKIAKLPCTHHMCHSCLKRLFKLAVTDPAHMPPRCCTEDEISLKHVDTLFSQEFKKNYNRKLKEYSTKNKIYCPTKGCGEWVQPKHMVMDKGRKIGRCPKCKTYVCGICSQKMHKTKDCPKDPATKEFAEAAEKAGWQRCYSCSAMVELKEGCNHMTCRCTAEFCMVCGSKWKSCDCPWFTYGHVDAFGDPIRYQQEMDRRREQELRDEEIARRLQASQVEEGRPGRGRFERVENFGPHRLNPVFVHRGLNALTANYGGATRANETLFSGQAEVQPGQTHDIPGGDDYFPQMHRMRARVWPDLQDPAAMDQEQPIELAGPDGIRVVRHGWGFQ